MKERIFGKLMIFLLVFFAKTGITGERANPYVTIDQETVLSELEISKFFYTWNRTKTFDGVLFLKSFLLYPIKDKKVLLDRQNFIKKLVNEREAFEKLQRALEEIAQVEQVIFEYFKRDEEGNSTSEYVRMFNAILSSTTGIKKITNFNSLTQEGWFAWRAVSSFLPLFGMAGGQQLFWEFFQKFINPNYKIKWNIFTTGTVSQILKQNSPFRNIKKPHLEPEDAIEAFLHRWPRDIYDYFRQDMPPVFNNHYPLLEDNAPIWKKISQKISQNFLNPVYQLFFNSLYKINRTPVVGPTISLVIATIPTILQDAGLIYTADVSIKNLKMIFTVIAMMQHYFCMIRKYVELVEKIVELQEESELLSKILPSIAHVFSNANFQEIVSLLKTETFKSPSKYFFFHGRAMHLQKLMNEHFRLFMPLTSYIAELDAYMSIAELIRECENTDQKFSFVEYVESDEGAIIDAKGAWHPLLFGISTKQDVQLGALGDTQHVIITGPNWSGKSIYLKTVGIIAYLAQTLTIAPVDSCSLTLFSSIKTSLDPKGDISKELSKFKKQQDDLEDFKTVIAMSNNDNKSLLLVDEILSGTVDDMIAARSIEFGTSIAPTKHAIVLVTTHVFEPTELEQLTNGLFKNFHIEIIPQDNGTFVRTFRIIRGPATWWFDSTKKMLRMQFIDWVNSKNKTSIPSDASPTQ